MLRMYGTVCLASRGVDVDVDVECGCLLCSHSRGFSVCLYTKRVMLCLIVWPVLYCPVHLRPDLEYC